MIQDRILQQFQALFPTAEQQQNDQDAERKSNSRDNGVITTDYDSCGYHIDVQVDAEKIVDAVTILDQNEFFIESITGVDWIKENQLEVVYDFSRFDFDLCRVVIRCRINRGNPQIPTITDVFRGANWHERETHDFFGIKFLGHPNLIPLLLPEDADFHPLLKDFKA